MQILLRILVVLLALAGAAGSAFLALGINTTLTENDEAAERSIKMTMGQLVKKKGEMASDPLLALFVKANTKVVDDYPHLAKVLWFLYAGVVLGLLGMLLAVRGRGKGAAVLFLLSIVGPVLLMYDMKPTDGRPHVLVLVGMFMGALPVAGLLSLLIRPRRSGGPVRDEDE